MHLNGCFFIALLLFLQVIGSNGSWIKKAFAEPSCEHFPNDCELCRECHNVPGLGFAKPMWPTPFMQQTTEHATYICRDKSIQKGEFYALRTTYRTKDENDNPRSEKEEIVVCYDKETKTVLGRQPRSRPKKSV